MDGTRLRWTTGILLLASAALHAATSTTMVNSAHGYFRLAESRLTVNHAVAVTEEQSDGELHTLVFLSAAPLDAGKVAAAFHAMDAVREQEPAGGFVRVCIDASGEDCGVFFSPEGFNSGGYGQLELQAHASDRIAGRFHLDRPEDFLGRSYQFDLTFDTVITPAPGTPLPEGGGAPGKAYNAYLAALAKGDLAALRAMLGDDGPLRYPDDDATAAKESLKSDRDGQPLHAEISRGQMNGDDAVLWVRGVDRDEIPRTGRVLMHRMPQGWRFEEADLDSADD